MFLFLFFSFHLIKGVPISLRAKHLCSFLLIPILLLNIPYHLVIFFKFFLFLTLYHLFPASTLLVLTLD